MKQRIYFWITIYFWFLLMLILQKPLFMLYHWAIYGQEAIGEWLAVMWHGIPLDIAMAAYLTALPGLFIVATVYFSWKGWPVVFRSYFTVISLLVSIIAICDAVLYSYWGFRMDATPLFYLASPKEAMASVSLWQTVLVPLFIIVYATLLVWPLWRFSGKIVAWNPPSHKFLSFGGLFLLTALLFIPIRGGFSVATLNVGRVYFSERMPLNHAAINPVFSFMVSLTKSTDFASQYRSFDSAEMDAIFEPLRGGGPSVFPTDSTQWIKPDANVVLIVLEGFPATAMESLGGKSGVMPHLEQIASEGIFFTHCYATGSRTDKGLTSILSGYPAQPTTSIMKYPVKSQSLPSISRSLRNQGYDTQLLYGGDADFSNMRSYFISMGIDDIVCDTDFPISQQMSKWGVHDHVTFDRLYSLFQKQSSQPFMKMFLTLSSHEPFEVPMQRFSDKQLNSIAYTDSCLGSFVDKVRRLPMWENTLIIFVSDHAMLYPLDLAHYVVERHHIPMVWTGGAVLKPRVVETYLSQVDLAATLLAQLHIPYDDFLFSKNIVDTTRPQFAFYTFKDGFGFLDASGCAIYDWEAGKALIEHEEHLNKGKAYLQKLYDDLAER